MPPVIIVILKLPYTNLQRPEKYRTFEECLALLKNMVEQAYSINRCTYPDSPIIVAWNEYGIFGNDAISVAGPEMLTRDQKYLFKSEMLELLKGKDEFTIIAGTVLYARNMAEKYATYKYVTKAKDNYEKAARFLNEDCYLFSKSKSKTDQLLSQIDKQHIRIRNVCYIFTNSSGRISISKQDKLMPCYEKKALASSFSRKSMFFQPGTRTNIIRFSIPYNFTLAVEICLDHKFGVLRQQCKLAQPDFQFVISNTIFVKQENVIAPWLIHADANVTKVQHVSDSAFNVLAFILDIDGQQNLLPETLPVSSAISVVKKA